MKTLKYLFALIYALIFLTGSSYSQSDSTNLNLEGNWLGTLEFSGVQLRIVFNIKKSSTGYSATLDSPDQGAKDIPTENVTLNGNNLQIDVPSIHGSYSGVYIPDSSYFTGTWAQGGQTLPLSIKRTTKTIELNRPQEPVKPYPYNEEEVTYENKEAGITLSGTFTYPKVGKSFTAVLLIPGSGAHNRDEEVFGHKPFLVLSDYLTRHGIAVLRYDDRGVGKSTGDFSSANTKDLASDALAGVKYLSTRKDVKQIGLIGHSEGGIIAPMVANEYKNVSFVVLMAAPGIPSDKLLLQQAYLIGKGSGEDENMLGKTNQLNQKIFNIIKTESDSLKAWDKIKVVADDFYNRLSEQKRKEIGDAKIFENQLKPVMTKWFRYFIKYNPIYELEKLKCPVLAINGSKDVQVPAKENLAAINNALTKGGNKSFKIIEIDGLNHLFQTAATGLPSEYAKISETISPKALDIISNWISKR